MTPRVLVANLAAEEELAGRGLGRGVRELVAGFGTLMRAFAREGDTILLSGDVPRERIADVPWLDRVDIRPRSEASSWPAGAPVLPWMETPSTSAVGEPIAWLDHKPDTTERAEWVRPAVEVVKAVHDRSFAHDVATRLGCALPGSRVIDAVDELADAVAGFDPEQPVVLKARLSASGRGRLLLRPRDLDDGDGRERVDRFASRWGGRLLVEPWLDRVADFGACGLVTDDRHPDAEGLQSFHAMEVDPRDGRFIGVVVSSTAPRSTAVGLSPREARRLSEVTARVGVELRLRGYRGPFGVDAFRYRDADGSERFHPLCEVNARLTFGWVARALADRVDGDWRRVRLRLGAPVESTDDRAEPVALLRPAAGAPGAWVAIER